MASWSAHALDAVSQDVRFSVATLRRSPAFVATAAAVLALGIGVTTAIFSIVNAVFFRPLGVERPHELVYLYEVLPRSGRIWTRSYPDLELFARSEAVFSGLTAHWGVSMPLTIDGEAASMRGEQVAANYFDVLGVTPLLGRTFTSAEGDLATTGLAVVISHDLWQRRFAGAADVIGRTIQIGSQQDAFRPFTIVGVVGPAFKGLSDPWSPSQFWVTSVQYSGADYVRGGVNLVGRLAVGVTLEQARAAIAVQNEQSFHERSRNWPPLPAGAPPRTANPALLLPVVDVRTPFDPAAEVVPGRLATAVGIVVALVLLVAASNVAGILRARGVARTGEVAVRRALGAGTFRLARQLVTESLVLSCCGGIVGLLIAAWLVGLYRAYTPDRFMVPVSLNIAVLAFTFGLCVVVGLTVSLGPAAQALRVNVTEALGAGAGTSRRTRTRLRHGIVVPQVAVSLLLLLVAGVHVRSLTQMEMTNPGYDLDGVAVLSAGLLSRRPFAPGPPSPAFEAENADRHRRFYRQLNEQLPFIPGAESVAIASTLPVSDWSDRPPTFVSQDALVVGAPDPADAFSMGVSPAYFHTMGMSLLRGRDFDARDVRGAPPVTIVSESVAARLWPHGEAVGKMLAPYSPDRPDELLNWATVIGVVSDAAPILRPSAPMPIVYEPLSQQWRPSSAHIIARVDDERAPGVIASLRAAVTGADAAAAVYRSRTMRQISGELLYPRRAAATVLAASGLVGLLLAAVGLYGVVSYAVAQRLREISIRMAIGASRRDIVGLVLRDAAAVAALGAAVGLPLGLAALRTTATLVGPLPSVDVVVLLSAPALVASVTLAACYLPARRAASADPADVLRRA